MDGQDVAPVPVRRFVWLACKSDESMAKRGNRDIPDDSKIFLATKLRKLVDTAPVLVEHFRAEAVEGAAKPNSKNLFYKQSEAIRQICSKKIVGLAVVEVSSACAGVFSILDMEQRALLQYTASADKRVGSVFLRVLDAVALQEPCLAVVSGVKTYANHKSFVLTSQCVQNIMRAPLLNGQPFEDFLDNTWWSLGDYDTCIAELGETDPGPMCAMVFEGPVAMLVAHGFLSHLVVKPSSRFAPHPYLDPVVAEIRRVQQACSRPNAEHIPGAVQLLESECLRVAECGVDRDMLLSVADSLRLQLQVGIAADTPEVSRLTEDQQLALQRQIVWMEGFYRASSKEQVAQSRLQRSSKGFQGIWDNDMGCRVTYKPCFLLQCVVLSFDLRSSDALPDVIKAAVNTLPEVWKQTLVSMMAGTKTPSPSTLSRARLSVDVGFMLWMRKQHAQLLQDAGITFFMKVDSTPLGGNNWEVVEYQVIKGDKVLRAGEIAAALPGLGAQCANQQVSLQDVKDFSSLTDDLSKLISHHVLPLGALGTRLASIAHIVHSIPFRLRLECFEWGDVVNMVLNTFSLTADQGTESKLGDIERVDLQENFPWWPVLRQMDFSEDPFLHEQREVHDELCLPDAAAHPALQALPGFVSSVRIPPHFHIIDKVSNSLLSALTLTWPRIEKGFKAIVIFFHAGHTRRHFVKLCVPQNVQFLFSSGPLAWDGGRVWGVLQKIVHWILKREGAIKRNFDARKLLSTGHQQREPQEPAADDANAQPRNSEGTKRDFFEDKDGSNTWTCNAAVQDSFFWGAMHMLSRFADLLDHMQAWMLGCPCHPPAAREEVEAFLGKSGLDIALACPMRGRRAPDLATGQFREIFKQAAHEQEDMLFMVNLASLPERDRRDIMLDFAAGQARLLTEVEIRLSVWDTLPLKLFALGHPDQDLAREAILKCCVQFEELSAAEQESSVHQISSKLFSRNSDVGLRADVVSWLQGNEQSSPLRLVASQMALTPTLEISVERLHAFLKQRTLATHHISGAYASLQLRRPEILRCHADHFDELSECCSLAATPADMIESLELQLFPDFLQFHVQGENGGALKIRGSVPHGLVDNVLYRRHLDVQYQALPNPQFAAHRRSTACHVDSENTAEQAVAYEHFRATFRFDCFYSVKKSKDSLQRPGDEAITHEDLVDGFFVPIERTLRGTRDGVSGDALKRLQLEITGDEKGLPLALTQTSGADMSLDFMVSDCGSGPGLLSRSEPGAASSLRGLVDESQAALQSQATRRCQESDYIFFRVVDAHPGHRKRLRTDLMQAISSAKLAVTVHDVVHLDLDAKTVTVRLQPSGSESSAARLLRRKRNPQVGSCGGRLLALARA